MGSSGDVTTKILNDRHRKKRQHLKQRNKVLRAEIERLHGMIKAQQEGHLGQLYNARDAVTDMANCTQEILDKRAAEVKGYEAARERLKRGLVSRLWFALGLARRGSFA